MVGAIGIARCFAFSGHRSHALFDPTRPPFDDHVHDKASYRDTCINKNAAVNHFFHKLFKLKDMMKTDAGRRRAAKRHDTMVKFIDTFTTEWNTDM